ncbi:MAG: aldo/keto reductase [Candidatus Bathyarchaeota archaeon]|jgi:D-threo-aldose 1-dehydrogenase|nr:aldo/keto reductase [Candidatus Bathyarchaeota archaeon]MDP7207601.1 aldo/keto reductase [Candidatus Bathyarchaeota archaeon]MDP7443021.1 aldo/keto reductase [Candidatus Bathyarchaeota archaeon]
MDPLEKTRIGKTDLQVTLLGLGCSGLARADTTREAIETFRTAMEQGVRYIDTAPLYGQGRSEARLGEALKDFDREKIVISTKVGRLLRSTDNYEKSHGYTPVHNYTRGAIVDSLESSLGRLGVDSVDILYIHDADNHWDQAIGEGYPALAEMRDDGKIKAIGAGMNQWEMELRFAQEGEFDCFLLAGRYTLLEQKAITEFLPYCEENHISVVIGGPYNSGVLAKPDGRYNYKEVPPEVSAKVARLQEVCIKHGVPMRAAALQFVMAHPAVASVIPGTKSPRHQEDNFRMMSHPIPGEFWEGLREKELIHPDAPVPQ